MVTHERRNCVNVNFLHHHPTNGSFQSSAPDISQYFYDRVHPRACVTTTSNRYIAEQHEPLIEKNSNQPTRRNAAWHRGSTDARLCIVRRWREEKKREDFSSRSSVQIKLTSELMRYEMKIINRQSRGNKKISRRSTRADDIRKRERMIFLPRFRTNTRQS